MGRAGASEGRGGSSLKVSTKRGGSYLFVSYSRRGSHTFSRICNEDGQKLPTGDWKSEYSRLLDLESANETSFQMLLLGGLSCSSCAVYVASEFGSVNFS